MKKFIYLCVFFPLISFSQSITVEYDVTLNSLKRTGKLHINTKKVSFYTESLNTKGTREKEKEENQSGSEKVFYIVSKTNRDRTQIYDFKSNILRNIDYIGKKKVLCEEEFPKINWTLTDETRSISGYDCTKAITTFRGRNYTAWFTQDLPSKVGPWKFNNLPGLILQVYDDDKKFSWTATKISKNDKEKEIVIDSKWKKMTLQEFVTQNDKSKNEQTNRLLLKYLERGGEVIESSYTRGREAKFEWETKEN